MKWVQTVTLLNEDFEAGVSASSRTYSGSSPYSLMRGCISPSNQSVTDTPMEEPSPETTKATVSTPKRPTVAFILGVRGSS